MSTGATLRFEDAGAAVRCVIELDRHALEGHAAKLEIVREVKVNDSRPVHRSETLFEYRIARLARRQTVDIAREKLRAYSYRGSQISIVIEARLTIDDGVIFDTTLREEQEVSIGLKPRISSDAKGIVEPKDAFDLIYNLRAIPPGNRLLTLALLAAGGVLILFNTWVGWHDQWASDALTWFYSHRDSDGDSQSPLQNSLLASGALGAAIWYAVKRQLRKYMTFAMARLPARVGIDHCFKPGELLTGVSRVDLRDVVVRIVACNMELGQYKRGTGSKERTVSFSHPVRAVILYDRRIDLIPAGARVQDHFDGECAFASMFKALYPPQRIGESHGLSVHWEVQLIHDRLIDQEIVCDSGCFVWEDFLKA